MFWTYGHFLLLVAGSLDRQSSWCEGCSCHENILQESKSYQERKRKVAATFADAAGVGAACPLKGRRSHEFACGIFNDFVENLLTTCRARTVALSLRLEEDMRTALLQDCYAALDLVLSTLRLKTAHWRSLPWKLCALASDDAELARKHAREALEMFETAASQAQAQHVPEGPGAASTSFGCHHFISRLFLSPDTRSKF